jgi:hypothetical protein
MAKSPLLVLLIAFSTSACSSPAAPGHSMPAKPGQTMPPSPSKCGDLICSQDESCTSCAQDCGPCPKCSAAPSCTDAAGVPASPLHRQDLDKGVDHPMPDMAGSDMGPLMSMAPPPASSATDCGAAQLRVRLKSIMVTKHGGTLFCIATASDGVREEVVLTQPTKDMQEGGDTNYFDSMLTTFWGGKGVQETTNNLTMTINCYKAGNDAWSKALGALSDAAGMQNGGPYGWAFGIGAAGAAAAAGAAKALEKDEHPLNQQQTLSREDLLDLTNGRTWDVRESGSCGFLCDYDWTVTLESWGCANSKTPNPS